MNTATSSPFTSPDGLAERWDLDKKTVLNAIDRGEIPCTKVGRRWLIPMTWVEAQEAAGHTTATELLDR
jgi:excisionase family DNA binding protein